MMVEIKVETQPKAKAKRGRKPVQPLPQAAEAKPEATKATSQLPTVDTLNELAEERLTWSLAKGLYRTGQLLWQLVPYDKDAAEAYGVTLLVFNEINSEPALLQSQKDLLITVERLPHREQVAALVKLSPREWELYRACRYGRDLALARLIREQPCVVPEKLKRIGLLANLTYAQPIAEIEAEAIRQTFLLETGGS